MSYILLDANIARAIGRALRSEVADTPAMDLFHRALADILFSAVDEEETPTDAEIRKAIFAQLYAEHAIEQALISVSVHDGVVELRGTTRASITVKRCMRLRRVCRASRLCMIISFGWIARQALSCPRLRICRQGETYARIAEVCDRG